MLYLNVEIVKLLIANELYLDLTHYLSTLL